MSDHPLRKLEALDEQLESKSGYTGTARWMIPYADFLTLLLGFFIILFAMTKSESQQTAQAFDKPKQQLVATQTLDSQTPPLQQTQASPDVKKLVEQLKAEGQPVSVTQDQRGVVLSFQERIFFEPGKAELSPQARKTLDKLSEVLMSTPHPIRVEGHTDNTPIHTAVFPSNWELSTARATTIVKHLIETRHFPPNRLSAAGYGEYYPLAQNSSIEGKQKNRRVDIVLLNTPASHRESPIVAKDSPDRYPKE